MKSVIKILLYIWLHFKSKQVRFLFDCDMKEASDLQMRILEVKLIAVTTIFITIGEFLILLLTNLTSQVKIHVLK